MNPVASFLHDERGAESVEWGVLAGVIAGVIVLAVLFISGWSVEHMKALQGNLEPTAG